MTLTIASVNVNGIRAAMRNGMGDWLSTRKPDIVLLQETRAPATIVEEFFPGQDGWHVAVSECAIKGRAGVAVVSQLPIADTRAGVHPATPDAGEEPPVDTGRWLEADIDVPHAPTGVLTVTSAYLHSGNNYPGYEASMEAKYAHLDRTTQRLADLATSPTPTLVAGDLNIAHTKRDIKNWRTNQTHAGFLPEERAYVTQWIDEQGWQDTARALHPDVDGPYTWWSWRGQAFANDSGWRIDYQLANPALAPAATQATVDKAADRAGRWSDHAPLVVTWEF
ncbi:MAG: endonuclease/exonuclease/phosphatase family protein [Cellulomonadaceae bacterium]|nr:endonuclease/exonuclease/phosphatase family protein [Cellulomonadaceae bacterium]